MRNSSACPRRLMSSCSSVSGSPAAMRSCQPMRSTPGGQLGDRMLDLEPGVHLDEVERRRRRPGTRPCRRSRSRRPRGGQRGLGHRAGSARGSAPVEEQRAARLLDDLLVPPLDAALALEDVKERCRGCHRESAPRCAAARGSSARGRRRRGRTRTGRGRSQARKAFSSSACEPRDRHADAAAAARGLAPAPGSRCARPPRRRRGVGHHAVDPGHDRDTGRRGQARGPVHLSFIRAIASGGGPTKTMPGLGAGAGELGALRDEAVARVDCLGAGLLRRLEQSLDVEVAVLRWRAGRCAPPGRPRLTNGASASASE